MKRFNNGGYIESGPREVDYFGPAECCLTLEQWKAIFREIPTSEE